MSNDLLYAPFWMVWNPNGHAPTFKHSSHESATAEAEHLARTNPERTFIVLEAIEARKVCDMVRVKFTRDVEVPF